MAKKASKTLKGVAVDHFKNTEDMVPIKLPCPEKVVIPMAMHIGAPCSPIVAKGDTVAIGQKIGDTEAFVSAPIHASISGTVVGIEQILNAMGRMIDAVVIKSDNLNTVSENVKPPVIGSKEEFLKAVRESGLVGLGGAGFPAHVKFNPKNIDEVDTLVINGAECEPYITSDYRTMMDKTDDLLAGIQAVCKYLNLTHVVIGIENNKPKAIEKLEQATANDSMIDVYSLDSKYPKGGEKILVYETTGRTIQEGKLPADAGVVVSNVTSIAFLGAYLRTGMPLVEKVITVSGEAVAEPKNIIAPIGCAVKDIFEFCGGFKSEPKKVLYGGLMMGMAICDLESPLLKNNNAILALAEKEVKLCEESACIRCGRCISVCPMNLMPVELSRSYEVGQIDMLKELKVNLCIECGCCSYVCPANKFLALNNKLAKQMIAQKK